MRLDIATTIDRATRDLDLLGKALAFVATFSMLWAAGIVTFGPWLGGALGLLPSLIVAAAVAAYWPFVLWTGVVAGLGWGVYHLG
jgi:VIT1/CCC1 family predicted Fe2+/Mn2+ transporter